MSEGEKGNCDSELKPAAVVFCCVPGCQVNSGSDSEASFSNFPRDSFLRREWILRISRLGKRGEFDVWVPKLHHKVCGYHFNSSGFKKPGERVPTLFASQICSDELAPDEATRPDSPRLRRRVVNVAVDTVKKGSENDSKKSIPAKRSHLPKKIKPDTVRVPWNIKPARPAVPSVVPYAKHADQDGGAAPEIVPRAINPFDARSVTPFDDDIKAMLSVASQRADQITKKVMFNPQRDVSVGCAGCFRRLQFGVVPKGLYFPSGRGVNVWSKLPDTSTIGQSVPSTSGSLNKSIPAAGPGLLQSGPAATPFQEGPTRAPADKHSINLCYECFNGHINGRRVFTLNVLGVSVVTALYKEDTKYLKVEGPTKIVTLGGESESELSTIVNDGPPKKPLTAKRKYPDRKILRPLTPTQDADEISVETSLKSEAASEKRSRGTVGETHTSNPVDYLSVGSGYLGSVEMTEDDCLDYEHVTIKQEPPDLSDMCILPGDDESAECLSPLQESSFPNPIIKMEVE